MARDDSSATIAMPTSTIEVNNDQRGSVCLLWLLTDNGQPALSSEAPGCEPMRESHRSDSNQGMVAAMPVVVHRQPARLLFREA